MSKEVKDSNGKSKYMYKFKLMVSQHFHRLLACYLGVFGSRTDPTSLFILFLLLDRLSLKSLRLHRFKSDRNEIWDKCSSSKYVSIHRVGFSI